MTNESHVIDCPSDVERNTQRNREEEKKKEGRIRRNW